MGLFAPFVSDSAELLKALAPGDWKTRSAETAETLEQLAAAGQSVTLTTLEDNIGWECSAIVGGKRYTAFGATADSAVRLCSLKVAEPR